MTTVTGSQSTTIRQSTTLSSGASGLKDSTSGLGISDFSGLLAALFAAPQQILVPNQTTLSANALSGGSQSQNANQTSNANIGSTQNSKSNNEIDSLSSLLFASALTNQASPSTTNKLPSAAILGPDIGNSLNSNISPNPVISTSTSQTLQTNSPAILGQVVSASGLANNTVLSILGSLGEQTTAVSTTTPQSNLISSPNVQSPASSTTSNLAQTNTAIAANFQNGLNVTTSGLTNSSAIVTSNQLAEQSQQTPSRFAATSTQNDVTSSNVATTSTQNDGGSANSSTNSQIANTTGFFAVTNQVSLIPTKNSGKLAIKPTLSESVKTAFDSGNSNLNSAANIIATQLLQTPVIAATSTASTSSSNSILSITTPVGASIVNQQLPINTNPNLNTAEVSVSTTFVGVSSSATQTGSDNSTSTLSGGTLSVVVTPALTTNFVQAANAAVANTTERSAILQSTDVLSSPVLANGRTPGQSVIIPTLPQSPLVPAAGADAYPSGYFSVTGIDRPTDAVSNLGGLTTIDTTSGGSALFVRERSDIADLNSLLRGQEPKPTTDNSSVALNGNSNFAKQVESLSTSAAQTPADQPSRVMTQIADALAERAQVIREKGSTEIRMRLDPPELGTIDIRVHSHKGELRADITAADPAVRTMIESQLSDLRSALEKSGLDFQSFNLNSGNRSDRGGQEPDNTGSSAGFDRKTPAALPVVVTPSAVVTPNRGALLDVTA